MLTIKKRRTIRRDDPLIENDENPATPENWGKQLVQFEDTDLEESETPLDRLALMLGSSAADDRAELKVYKSINGKLAYCRSYTPAEFENGSYELIRRQCGDGEYELRLYGNNENGKYCVRSRQPLTIAKLVESEPIQSTNQNNGLSQAIEALMKNQADMMRLISEKPAAPDPMMQMTQIFTMMGLMRDAMGINQSQQNQKSSIGEIVEAIKELKGAASIIAPEKEQDDESPMKMFGQITDLIKATGQQKHQSQQVQLLGNPNQPIQAPAENQQPNQTENMNILEMIKLKANLSALISLAVAEKPPIEGAELIYEKLPDEMIEVLGLEQWFAVLSEYAPECKPHEKWLTDARNEALKMFEQPDEPETTIDALAAGQNTA